MSNPHTKNVNTCVPTSFYVRRAGATATPLARWSLRRVALAQLVVSRGGALPVNIGHAYKTNTSEPCSQDLNRFISEGYAVLSSKTCRGSHLRPRTYRGGGKQHKTVSLTAKGQALLPKVVQVHVPAPYAKRAAALAQFEEANA